MQILTIQKGFEVFEWNFEEFERRTKHSNTFGPFETDLKSNGNSKDSKGIRIIRIQIQTTQKELEAFECKFEALKRDSKHSNPNSNFSKGIRSIQIQIRMTRKGFEAFESKFESLEKDSKHSN